MPRFMLDTNICIYLMKHHPPEVAARFAECYVGDVVMSAITLAELQYGVVCSGECRDQNAAALAALLGDIPVAAFDAGAAEAYGAIRLATRERKRDALDKLIAAHALALAVTLVTNNERDFADYPGLQIENWVGSR
ncbi:type II toxin-antitoxin system VapC family toxin [Plasticicumulans sp.]|mgnify:CR=1 FL=1|uniref:type II toxin-antitoxin system VapC family toxin n=1 Tax=Plasticicumulans sp. TaxID=2307179 RepID=UPI002C5DCDD7|nr:type II toxin-antitoxin system VapC family toxin [Plasticicumulans sp.]MBS0599805.1 type II toxin-antitoxin system VapC family toxin [Pseudomonadota bacterium]HMV39221.1 type II toxin-antitoxin system VapC family toxin [Plasticicumulans sp.]HMW29129.1 type II toxin-antitoxin system VapC family toxin [Plasticicumulans sp.]HMW43608.1 type II toxin-antitoxin system VapC family toxin [Plasticicumulans sp.]HMZ11933.1 type II toxin-antitoxin system VapC family toxin [Plasticicumulans sp.]